MTTNPHNQQANQDELREKLLDYFTEGAPSYKAANQTVQSRARTTVNAIMPLINSEVRSVLDEVKEAVSDEFAGACSGYEKEQDSNRCKWCGKTELSMEHDAARALSAIEAVRKNYLN